MNLSVKPELLKFTILSAGLLGLVLRMVLYATGLDAKGLLVSGHWASVAVWLLTAIVAAGLVLLTRSIRGPEQYRDAHPVSVPGGIGAWVLATAILLTTIGELKNSADLSVLLIILGFGAAASLTFIGLCRLSGTKPFFLCHVLVCGWFAMRMVSQYQHWSSDPQIQDYVFYLSAYVALMLTAYQQAAFDIDMGNHRALWAPSLAAVYLCCLSMKGTVDTWLLLASGIWAFTNLTSLTVKQRRQRPTMVLDEEPPQEEV